MILYRATKNHFMIMIFQAKSLVQFQQKKMKLLLVYTFFLQFSRFYFLEITIESEDCMNSFESHSDSEESLKEEESIIKRNKVEEEGPKPVTFANSFGSKVSFKFNFVF